MGGILGWISAKLSQERALVAIDTAKSHFKCHIDDFHRLITQLQSRFGQPDFSNILCRGQPQQFNE